MLTSQHTKAFTLVELAIVIVIIGLLVGGVLQGQALIKQAQINKTISDVENYSAAFATFFGKYNAVPGDMRNATTYWGEVSADCTGEKGTGTQTCNGDGDRVVDYDFDSSWETFRFWQHLSNAKLIKGGFTGERLYCGDANTCYKINENVPGAPIGGTLWGFWYINHAWGGKLNARHAFGLGSANGNGGRWHDASLTTDDAMALDTKYDDGRPYLGRVVNMNYSNTTNCTSTGTATIDANATYNMSTTGRACVLFIDSRF